MADRQDDRQHEQEQRHYSAHSLNIVFALSSIVLLVAIVLMFKQDYDREWRRYQKQFREIDREKTAEALAAEQARLEDEAEYASLSNRVEELEAEQAGEQKEIDALTAKRDRANGELDVAVQRLNFEKAEQSASRYRLEAAHDASPAKIARLRAVYEKRTAAVEEQAAEEEAIRDRLDEIGAELAKRTAAQEEAARKLRQMTLQRDLLARRLDDLDPERMAAVERVGDTVRDLPILDMFNPRYNIRDHQVIVDGITEDLIFTRVPRVDRCTVCHLAIDREGFEDQPNPFKTHPNIDQFVGVSSPHPMKTYGCTSCHAGRGRGTSFTSAAHMPRTPEQAEEWKQKYGWHKLHHWDAPMRPSPYTEGGCFECHAGAARTPGADHLNLGLALVERAGCYGCHEIEKYEGRSRVGPTLQRVSAKVTAQWAYHWVNDPKGFRGHTWMPAFFDQSNNRDIEARTDQEVAAMVEYLMAESRPFSPETAAVPEGDPERGRALAHSLGCQGCHMLPGETYPEELSLQALRRQQGPNLSGLGSKTTAVWVYNWLRDPHAYHPETRMPNLRLTEQEAADTTAYLMQSVREEFGSEPPPAPDDDVLNAIALEFMVPGMTSSQARNTLATMSAEEKQQYCGNKLIRRYGCFACHDIPGFEDARPIGTALTEIADKSVSKLDFALRHDLPHVNYAWFEEKLKDPRSFDEGLVKEPHELLKMPNFHLEPEAVTALVTALMGFTKPDEGLRQSVPQTPRRVHIQAGDALAVEYNCRGCHVLRGEGGAIHDSVVHWLETFKYAADDEDEEESGEEDDGWDDWGEAEEDTVDVAAVAPAYSPPNLTGEGAKVQPAWLFDFLQEPYPIRPWLALRMPTYGFNDEQLSKLTAFFSYDAGVPLFASVPGVDTNSASYHAGQDMFSPQVMSCARCHITGGNTPTGSTEDNWAPDLALAHERLRSDWILEWLADPQAIEPGTKMPAYWPKDGPSPVKHLDGDPRRQREAIRDYVFSLGTEK